MTGPVERRILSVLFVILLVNRAFMPVVSAQGLKVASAGNSVDAYYNDSNFTSTEKTEGDSAQVNPTNKNPPRKLIVMAAPVAIFGGIQVADAILALLGMASLTALVVYADGQLAYIKDNEYIKITNSVAHAALTASLNELHLLTPAKSYKEAYSRPQGGLKWGNEPAVTDAPDPCDKGKPETSVDYTTPDGSKLLTRYYYNAKGVLEYTWDYDGHTHHKRSPHAHKWYFHRDVNGICIRKDIPKSRPEVVFSVDGTETLMDPLPPWA